MSANPGAEPNGATGNPPQTSEPEGKTKNTLPEEEAALWQFFIHIGLRGAADLRKETGINETEFRHMAPQLHAQPGGCYVYRVLDEVQKAALSLSRWRDFLSEGFDPHLDPSREENQLERIALEHVIDEQQFRARKLAEALVDSILFSTTNDAIHYGDYFYMHELDEYARSQRDRREFFEFQNKSTEWSAQYFLSQIRQLEQNGLEPKSRCYLQNPGPAQSKWTTTGVTFASFQKKYREILSIALPSELTALGKSYVHAYGSLSKDVHFAPHDMSSSFSVNEILNGANRVGFLILALIIRCQHLLGRIPDGINKSYREMHDTNSAPSELVGGLKKKPAERGDIVIVRQDLAEVLDVKISKYGYPAYHVVYIGKPPLDEVPDDWFAGFEVKLVAKKERVEKILDRVAEEIRKAEGDKPDFKSPTRERLLGYAKKALVKLHDLRAGRYSGPSAADK